MVCPSIPVSFSKHRLFFHTEPRNGTIEGTLQQGTTRRLVHRFETWKTQDDLNFVKSSDITQVIDFNGTKPGNGSEHYEKAKSSFGRYGDPKSFPCW